MNKQILFALLLSIVIFSCNKKEDDENPVDIAQLNNGMTTSQYAPYTTGSTFNYKNIDLLGKTTETTWTVLEGKEIDGKFYIEVDGFLGATSSGYFNCEGGIYTIYIPATVLTPIMKMVYLKENVSNNTQWEHITTMSSGGSEFQNKHVFTFIGKESSRTVEGVQYNDIIHIQLDTYLVFQGEETLMYVDHHYWAKGIGLIEKSGDSGSIFLLSYNIQ